MNKNEEECKAVTGFLREKFAFWNNYVFVTGFRFDIRSCILYNFLI